MDALSEVLQRGRLSGAVYCHAELSAPWALAVPRSPVLARALLREPQHLIDYHLLLEGEAWLRVGRSAPLRLSAGDLVMLPRGQAHRLSSDAAGQAAVAGNEGSVPAPAPGEIGCLRLGGGGTPAHLVCGYVALDRALCADLLDALPRVLRVHAASGEVGFWLATYLRLRFVDKDAEHLGNAGVLAKLSRLVFVEAVRRHALSLPPGQGGWLGALQDPPVARALALLHTRPGEAWTPARLAAEAGAPRTGLATRFRARVGQAPMRYLAQWRMTLAAHLLERGPRDLQALAAELGYGSEAAFSRAFRRRFSRRPQS